MFVARRHNESRNAAIGERMCMDYLVGRCGWLVDNGVVWRSRVAGEDTLLVSKSATHARAPLQHFSITMIPL
jgi:hypothetical protein